MAVTDTVDLDREIRTRIRAKRESLGIRSNFLAQKLGISPQLLNHYENGHVRVTATRLVEIARVLRVAPAELLPEA